LKNQTTVFICSIFSFFSALIFADPQVRIELPFQLHDGHMIIVEGQVGEYQNLNLMVDSGASRTVIDSSLAKRLGLKGENRIVNAYGKKQKVKEALLEGLRIGDMHFERVKVQIAKVSFNGMDRQIRIDGLIGLDLLRKTGVSIDYKNQKISFGAVDHTDTFFHFYGQLLIIPVPVYIDGRRVDLLLDTGAKHLILYERKTEGKVPMRKNGEKIMIKCLGRKVTLVGIRLNQVKIGQSIWNSVSAYLLDVRCSKDGPQGVLGVASLGIKKLNIDFQKNTVSWEL